MAALISSVMSTKDRVPFYVAECADMGIEVLPPDVNESQSDFAVVDGKIRFGLSAVKNVGEGAVRLIIEARQERPFESIWDFCERVGRQRAQPPAWWRAWSPAARSTAPGPLAAGDDRGARAGAAVGPEGAGRTRMMGQSSIFDIWAATAAAATAGGRPACTRRWRRDEWDRDELLRREKEVLGLYVSSHPLTPIRAQLARQVDVPLRRGRDAPRRPGRDGRRDRRRRSASWSPSAGDTMAFVELDDASGTVEVTVFAKTWATGARGAQADASC